MLAMSEKEQEAQPGGKQGANAGESEATGEGGEEPDHTAFVKEDQSDFIQAQWKSITPLWKSVAFQRSRRVLRTGFTPQNFKISIRSLFPVPDNSRF